MWRDVERRARQYGIPFGSIPDYPIDSDELANRVATVASIEGWCQEFANTAYAKWFLENKDPGKPEHLSDVLRRIGRNPDMVISQANGQTARDRYVANTELARSKGIFGSPTFAYGSEIFWGDDRLEDAIAWCKSR